jgi:hypothetical protein
MLNSMNKMNDPTEQGEWVEFGRRMFGQVIGDIHSIFINPRKGDIKIGQNPNAFSCYYRSILGP